MEVTGRRYDVWKKEISKQKYIIRVMAEMNITTFNNVDQCIKNRLCRKELHHDYLRHPLHPPRMREMLDRVVFTENAAVKRDFQFHEARRIDFMLKADLSEMSNYFGIGRERLSFFRKMALVFFKDEGLVIRPGANLRHYFAGHLGVLNMRKRPPIATGMQLFSFKQVYLPLFIYTSLE